MNKDLLCWVIINLRMGKEVNITPFDAMVLKFVRCTGLFYDKYLVVPPFLP